MTAYDLLSSGMDMPLSLGSTLWQSTKEGAAESFGLGTALRSMTLPPEAPVSLGRATGMKEFAGVLAAKRSEMGVVTEDQYKSSASFRESIPWDRGMTEERAKALAEMDDVRKVREFYAAKRPVTAFMGKLAGSAVDPINYVPIFGEYVAGANVARFGYVAGRALTASADAAANTAIAGLATAPARSQLGDDVSWQSTVSQIALAGLIGAGFGTAVGAAGARRAGFMADATDRLATLKRTQESRVVLNDAIDSLSRNGRVELSPASHGFIERAAADVTYASQQPFLEPLRASVGPAEAPRIDEVTGVEGFTVFHGSPHTFDRFSMEHIGKGEGAQAYGHGLYFAESKGVAKSYRDALSNADWTVNGHPYDANNPVHFAALTLKDFGNADVATRNLKRDIEELHKIRADWTEAAIKEKQETIRLIERGGLPNVDEKTHGSTYEVRIRANPEDFLDWDKPLSEQSPKVNAALAAIDNPIMQAWQKNGAWPHVTGKNIYDVLSGDRTRAAVASGKTAAGTAALKDAGVAGIKYLDAGSRTAGDGSRNFVVFDDSLLHTIRRNDEFIAKQPQDLRGRATAQLVANSYMPEDFIAEPNRAVIESQIGKPDNIKAIAEQYRVNPDTGEFPEQAELDQLIAEGRLSEEDAAMLKVADENFTTATAFGDALKAAMTCVV